MILFRRDTAGSIRMLLSVHFLLFAVVGTFTIELAAPGKTSSAIAGVLAVLLLSALVMTGTARRLVAVLSERDAILNCVANGDLAMQPVDDAPHHDESHRVVARIFAQTFDMVSAIRNGSVSIAVAAGTLTKEHALLSSRIDSQNEALQSTAAAIEQISAAVGQNADHANNANQLARDASRLAADGGGVILDVVQTMETISASSARMTDIVGTIDAIALQTNILALNAAVEAARAGDSGRGFAVVAGEVRNLAQRAAIAAKEINDLISHSVSAVASGTRLVGKASEAIDGIVASTRNVSALMNEIAASSQEQKSGIEQVSVAVVEIEGLTQKNSDMVRKALAAVQRLQNKARQLTKSVAAYRLGALEYGNRDEAVALVDEVVGAIAREGVEPVLREMNSGVSKFVSRDLYVVVLDETGVLRASSGFPDQVGMNTFELRDVDGKYFARQQVARTTKEGSAWVDYKYRHPITEEIMDKSAYCGLVTGLVVLCGYYKPEPTC